MCEYGDTVDVRVRVPADLCCIGMACWKKKPIDRCIAAIVQALQIGGIYMRSSCCGHGKGPGEIVLQDGRILSIYHEIAATKAGKEM